MKIAINLKELPIEVEFDYFPEEEIMMYYPNGDGYPGSSAEAFIKDISHFGQNINKFIDEMDWWDYIEELVLEEINKSREE